MDWLLGNGSYGKLTEGSLFLPLPGHFLSSQSETSCEYVKHVEKKGLKNRNLVK